MLFDWIIEVFDAQTHNERQPQRNPDQHDIGRDLDQPFLPPGSRNQKRSNFIHDAIAHQAHSLA
ncbi:hypothetical protein D3C81_2198880 [compost metagenome]